MNKKDEAIQEALRERGCSSDIYRDAQRLDLSQEPNQDAPSGQVFKEILMHIGVVILMGIGAFILTRFI